MQAARIKQMNLVGPAGYISMEDGEATELVQNAITDGPDHHSFMGVGKPGCDGEEGTLLTEAWLCSYWRGYRQFMSREEMKV